MLRHYMCFAVFYFLYDTYAMFVVFRESRESKPGPTDQQSNGRSPDQPAAPEPSVFVRFLKARPLMVAHHMVLPLILFPIFMAFDTGLGDCLLSIGFLMEASTPFVSARKILSVVGKDNSPEASCTFYALNCVVKDVCQN